MIDLNFFINIAPQLIHGTSITLQIALYSSLLGLFIGTLVAIGQGTDNKVLHWLLQLYLTLFRGTPMLIQIPFLHYLLPEFGIHLSVFATSVVAIGLNSGAYISQIILSGINSVGVGQREAAHVLGFTKWQTLRSIILPQAFALVIPGMLNEFITLIKDSSLASVIGVVELFKEGSIVISQTYKVIPVYCAVASCYLVITTTLSFIAAYLEKRMNRHVTH